MTPTTRTGAAATLALASLLLAAVAAAQAPPPPAGALARVGDETITQAEVEGGLAAELSRLDQQRHSLIEGRLDQLIGDRLIAQEARRRQVPLDQIVKAEITDKTPVVSGGDVEAFITQNRARLPRMDENELRGRVADYLRAQAAAQQRQAFVTTLRARADVRVYLKEPEPLRVQVDPARGFVRGPKEAPVTIVEFSDFQCPFCKTVVGTLKQVAAKYPDRVRWVFRDFPIPGLHPGAPPAHEAARCAGAQGKFWEYHDVLFERSPRHSPDELKQYAKELGLDEAGFAQCFDRGQFREAVAADMQEGARVGVTGTPTFFINGRMLVGNQPLSEFEKVIERELARTAAGTTR